MASQILLFDNVPLTGQKSPPGRGGVLVGCFPPAFPSETAIGSVSKEVADYTGLPLQAIVTTGGHDHLCGALAAGVTHPGQLLESIGTASVLLAVSNAFRPSPELLAAGCTTYANVVQHTYATLGTLDFAGGALEWIVTLLYGQGKQGTVSSEIYGQALHEAAEIPPGAHGAITIPSFLGSGTPYGQSSAHGAMLGLTPSHSRPELVRAMMEGLAFLLRDNTAMFYGLGIAPLKPQITVIGGTTQAAPLLQIKADIAGCPINVPQITEAAATGAALLAGMGANIFHSYEEAASSVLHTVQIYEPDTQAVEKYNTIYEHAYLPARRLLI